MPKNYTVLSVDNHSVEMYSGDQVAYIEEIYEIKLLNENNNEEITIQLDPERVSELINVLIRPNL